MISHTEQAKTENLTAATSRKKPVWLHLDVISVLCWTFLANVSVLLRVQLSDLQLWPWIWTASYQFTGSRQPKQSDSVDVCDSRVDGVCLPSGPLCGRLHATPQNVTLDSNEATVTFRSGPHRSGRGFLISYATDLHPGMPAGHLSVLQCVHHLRRA